MGPQDLARPETYQVPVITRSGVGDESPVSKEEDVPMDSPPLLSESEVEYLLQDAELHHYLPNLGAVKGAADWRAPLCLAVNQIPTLRIPDRPPFAGVVEWHRLRHQA